MYPDRKNIQYELRKYIRVNTLHGLSLFITDIFMYMGLVYLVLFLPELWMKIIASVLAGVKISNLSVIAHDAAHNSLTKNKKINKFIAITSLIPCMFNYRLWLYDHNLLHHSRTNENFPDSYTPLSKEQYDKSSAFRKWKERLYRKPSLLYFGLYYILERWSRVKFIPGKNIPKKIHKSAWKYFVLILIYLTGLLSLLAYAPGYSQTGSITAIILGFAVPYYVFQSLYAMAVYVQHTHPEIPWFNYPPDRTKYARQEFISVHLLCPEWINLLVHNIFDHSAHHACPAIPCYELGKAQDHLDKILGSYSIKTRFSFTGLFQIMKTCKLYDYDKHCWLDFDGNQTSDINLDLQKFRYLNAA